MSRMLKSGLIQMSLPEGTCGDGASPEDVAATVEAMTAKHVPYIEEAGRQGVQVLCLQEVFNTPYFCPGQDSSWFAAAEPVPGPATEAMAEYARRFGMVIVVPVYEREKAGFLYNTAAVIDADGSYLGKYRKTHIPQVAGFWEKYFFRPGNLGYPVFDTAFGRIGVYICYDRHFPEGARALGLAGAEIVFNPSGHRRRPLRVPVEASSSPRTPSRTATSWAASTASARRSRGTSAPSTAAATSSDPRGRDRRPRRHATRTRCWWRTSTSG